MKLFKSKKYYYIFEYNGKPDIIKANSMQEAIDKIFDRWFYGGSKANIISKFNNDPKGLKGDYELIHNRSFFDGRIEAKQLN